MTHVALPMTGIRALLFFGQFTLLAMFSQSSLAIDWPQEVSGDEGTIVVYQPQPEKLEGNVLTGRSAMSLELNDNSEPIFGTFWFTARLDTDQDTDTAIVRDIKVQQVRWPDSKDAGEQRFTSAVETVIPKAGFEISLERLSASLATADMEQKSLENLNNDPPVIVFREKLAVLLTYDGKPRYSAIENSNYERVMNTPFAVVRDKKTHYLFSGQLWYQAGDVLGPWEPTSSPPADLAKMMPKSEDEAPVPAIPPEIVVATEPTELIVSDGKPNWESLPGGNVLYVSNTESPWLRDLPTGNMYLLLSGRWFRSKSHDGPWTFVRADELPAGFSEIPPASDIGGLRTSVAGTPEADEAVLDAQIPQTAAISRKDTTLEVEYDGQPKFESIKGTKVSYAVNTATQVLEIDNKYYAVDNAVWFVASAATGPWAVADEVPEEDIATIPPSSPVYNTTSVHIYESTPQVVYVGYTPGYMWSYPYYGVPVYGTGWRYPPYMGPYYYPRPPTWGFNVGYNPWTGWNFGVSWSNGFFSMGVSFGGGYNNYRRPYGGGWYGGGYRGPTVINTGDINIGNNVNVGNRTNIGDKMERNSKFNSNKTSNNLYNRPENRSRKADRATVQKDFQQAKVSRDRQNNVFADKDGNVARMNNDKWQTRNQSGDWKDNPSLNSRDVQKPSTRPTTKPATKPTTAPVTKPAAKPATRPASQPRTYDRQQDLNRANRARQTGASHERRAQRQRPSGNRQRR
ncbi:MAG: carbohydrate-binding family V/XII [Halioglobus sp.]